MKGKYQIPFKKSTGDLLSYLPYREDDLILVDNSEFYEEITFVRFYDWKTSTTLIFVTKAGCERQMFTTDFYEMVKSAKIDQGVVKGIFTYRKQGQYFGIKYLREI